MTMFRRWYCWIKSFFAESSPSTVPWRIGNHVSERSRLQDITISRYFSVPVFSSTTTRNAYEAVLYGICRIRFFSSSLVSCMCMQSFRGHECAPLPKRKRVLQQRSQKTSTSLSCAQLQKVLLQGKCSLNRAFLFALRRFGTLFLWKYVNPVQLYYLRKNSRLSFLPDLLRVTHCHIFNFYF